MKNRYVKGAKISEAKMRSLVKVFAADVPALTAAGLVGLNRNTTQRYYDRLRLRIGELARQEAGPMAGEVEVDESYFGARRVRGKRGRGASGKTPVIGLLKRGGKGLYANRRELLQTSTGAHYQGSGALGGHGLYRWLEVL